MTCFSHPISSYQSRTSSLPSPYLVPVIHKDEVGRRYDFGGCLIRLDKAFTLLAARSLCVSMKSPDKISFSRPARVMAFSIMCGSFPFGVIEKFKAAIPRNQERICGGHVISV